MRSSRCQVQFQVLSVNPRRNSFLDIQSLVVRQRTVILAICREPPPPFPAASASGFCLFVLPDSVVLVSLLIVVGLCPHSAACRHVVFLLFLGVVILGGSLLPLVPLLSASLLLFWLTILPNFDFFNFVRSPLLYFYQWNNENGLVFIILLRRQL